MQLGWVCSINQEDREPLTPPLGAKHRGAQVSQPACQAQPQRLRQAALLPARWPQKPPIFLTAKQERWPSQEEVWPPRTLTPSRTSSSTAPQPPTSPPTCQAPPKLTSPHHAMLVLPAIQPSPLSPHRQPTDRLTRLQHCRCHLDLRFKI